MKSIRIVILGQSNPAANPFPAWPIQSSRKSFPDLANPIQLQILSRSFLALFHTCFTVLRYTQHLSFLDLTVPIN
jgi:hypothetical protein